MEGIRKKGKDKGRRAENGIRKTNYVHTVHNPSRVTHSNVG